MKNRLYLVGIIFLLLFSLVSAKVANVDVPNTIKVGEKELVLNGAGIRTKLFKLYVGSLFLESKSSNSSSIINSKSPMIIRLDIISSLITAEKMEAATREGFQNSTNGNTAAIQEKIETFLEVFKNTIAEGDVFEFINDPIKGVIIFKNGKEVTSIKGLAFKKALFGIWLGNKPAQSKLKIAMLGK